MGFLEDEFEGAHGVLELVALESLRLNLVNAVQDLLEAVLQVFDALSIDLLDFLTLVGQLWSVLICDLLHGESRLVDERFDSLGEILQLLLLLLGDAEADQLVEAGFHEVIHACH